MMHQSEIYKWFVGILATYLS